MSDQKILDEQGNPVTTEQLVEAMSSWTTVALYIDAVLKQHEAKPFTDGGVAMRSEMMAKSFAFFASHMVEFSENMLKANTIYVSAQAMLMGVLEMMFSGMIAEKKHFGEELVPEKLIDEFMSTCQNLCRAVVIDISSKMANGSFVLRVMSEADAKANAPSTVVRQ